MATIYITIYDGASSVATGTISASAKLTVGASSTSTDALGRVGYNQTARIITDTACQIKRGTDPTADSDSEYLPAEAVEYFNWRGGDKLAVIQQQ